MTLTKYPVHIETENEILLVSFPLLGETSEDRIVIVFVLPNGEEWGVAARILVPITRTKNTFDEERFQEIVRNEVRTWGPINYEQPLLRIYWNEHNFEILEGKGERFPLLDS